jgi:putative ABC transport system substrate-binding protein
MKRREFITLLGCAAATWPFDLGAQERVRRVGVLMPSAEDDPEIRASIAAFQSRLAQLDWVLGQNIQIEYRFATTDANRTAVAKELVALHPDVIVTRSTPAVRAVMRETSVIPIVFTQVIEAQRQGIVQSIARPGGNVTGFTNYEGSIGGKWLELMKETAPYVKRVAVIFNPTVAPFADFFLRSIELGAPSFNITPTPVPIYQSTDIKRAIESIASEGEGGLIVVPDTFTVFNRAMIITSVTTHRIPAVYPFRVFALDGGLVSYGPDPADALSQAASYVDRILRGAKPADLPVQAPTKLLLVVNLKAAKSIGLTIPETFLVRADEVIE